MMIEMDPSTLAGVATIAASAAGGLLVRRGLAVLDAKRDARLAARARQRPQPRRTHTARHVPAGARR